MRAPTFLLLAVEASALCRAVAVKLGLDEHCLGLNHTGFPLPVDKLIARFNHSKKEYFDYLATQGYDKTLSVQGPSELIVPGTCLADPAKKTGKFHVIFIGDCFVRQSYTAYLRLMGQSVPAKLDGNLDRVDMEGTTFLKWESWAFEKVLTAIEEVVRDNGLDSQRDTVVFWMGAAIHGFFKGEREWASVTQRADKLHLWWGMVQDAYPGARIIWDSPSFIDMAILQSTPLKPDHARWSQNITDTMQLLNAIDETEAPKKGVVLTTRNWVSNHYRGLQCDGIHADPHVFTKASFWHCYGFTAYEDLVMQGTLHAACKPKEPSSLCTPH